MGFNLKLVFLLLLIGCSNDTEDMKQFIYPAMSGNNFEEEANLIIIGTSNGVDRTTTAEMIAEFPDLPSDGFIDDAFFTKNGSVGQFPYELAMNVTNDNVGGYGYEYRFAKNMINVKTTKVNLLKCARGSSRMGNNGGWSVGGSEMVTLENTLIGSTVVYDKILVVGWENDINLYSALVEGNFNALIDDIEGMSNVAENVEWYVLEMGPFTSGNFQQADYLVVKQAMENVVNSRANARLFAPTWLSPDSANFRDGLHYNAKSTDLISLKLIEAM